MGRCVVSPSSVVLSLSLQPPRECQQTVVAAGPWWPHGLYGCRASSHTRAGPRSDTTTRVLCCPPCAISCHSRLNEPCPRLTSRRSAALYRGSSQRQAVAPRPHRAWGRDRGQSVSPPVTLQVGRMPCTVCPGSCASKLEVSQHSQQAGMGLGQGSAVQCWCSVSLNFPFIP